MGEAVTIRKANISDHETPLEFEQGVVLAERPYDPTLKPHPNHYYDLRQMIDDPLTQLVVAETMGQLVGCGYARIEKAKQYLRHDKHAYVGFMYVRPEWRKKY